MLLSPTQALEQFPGEAWQRLLHPQPTLALPHRCLCGQPQVHGGGHGCPASPRNQKSRWFNCSLHPKPPGCGPDPGMVLGTCTPCLCTARTQGSALPATTCLPIPGHKKWSVQARHPIPGWIRGEERPMTCRVPAPMAAVPCSAGVPCLEQAGPFLGRKAPPADGVASAKK